MMPGPENAVLAIVLAVLILALAGTIAGILIVAIALGAARRMDAKLQRALKARQDQRTALAGVLNFDDDSTCADLGRCKYPRCRCDPRIGPWVRTIDGIAQVGLGAHVIGQCPDPGQAWRVRDALAKALSQRPGGP